MDTATKILITILFLWISLLTDGVVFKTWHNTVTHNFIWEQFERHRYTTETKSQAVTQFIRFQRDKNWALRETNEVLKREMVKNVAFVVVLLLVSLLRGHVEVRFKFVGRQEEGESIVQGGKAERGEEGVEEVEG